MRVAALESLRKCITPNGFIASGDRVGHTQIWTRDAMIASLGAVVSGEPDLIEAARASVRFLAGYQAGNGAIPNNVDSKSLRPNFRAYADGGLWWLIGTSVLGEEQPAVASGVLEWLACQDVDQSGLLSLQESSDWQDLFCTRGKGLYLNGLYVLALRLLGQRAQAQTVADAMNEFFWYRANEPNLFRHIRHTFSTESPAEQDSLGRPRYLPAKRKLIDQPHYLPWLGFRAIGEWFDSLGNLLAILAGVADADQTATILDFIERANLADMPARAIYPPIVPGDDDWRDYYGMLNLPGHYHNGGVWPFIGGLYVAALVRAKRLEQAEAALDRLAELNHRGGFNEWHSGIDGSPGGVRNQAWSAGMFLYACACVESQTVPLLR